MALKAVCFHIDKAPCLPCKGGYNSVLVWLGSPPGTTHRPGFVGSLIRELGDLSHWFHIYI